MKIVQNGDSLTGTTNVTGNPCIRHGTISGGIVGGNVTIGFVAAASKLSFAGRVSGMSMSGTWKVTACGSISGRLAGTWEASKQP